MPNVDTSRAAGSGLPSAKHRGWYRDDSTTSAPRLAAVFNGTEVFDFDANDLAITPATTITGALTLSGGLDNAAGALLTKLTVAVKTANYTVTAAESGTVYIANAADLVFTLPSTAAGLVYTFVNAAVSAGTGLSVSPAAADNINEGTDNKDLINSGASDVLGDSVTIVGDGNTGWFTIAKIGTWAAEG